jgi:hypothetical protein
MSAWMAPTSFSACARRDSLPGSCGAAMTRYLSRVRGQGMFHGMRTALLLFAWIAWPCLPMPATSVRAPAFEILVDRADLIFTGRAVAQRSEWNDVQGQKSIVTFVSFAVEKVHKGRADAVITLQFLGGTVGQVSMDVADMPRFRKGERAVLFIENNGLAASPVIGFFHGRFPLRKIGSGPDEMLKYNGEPLGDVAEIGQEKRVSRPATKRALSHDEFALKIRERLARAPATQP